MASTPTLESVVHVNDNVMFQELQGEAVLLNLNTGIYFGLDTVGTRIWQILQVDGRLSNVIAAMLPEYEVTRERLTEDLVSIVTEMEARGLVTIMQA